MWKVSSRLIEEGDTFTGDKISRLEVRRGAADGGVVLDLAVERLLAPQRPVAVQHPHDVIGQAGQDRLVVAALEALTYASTTALYDAMPAAYAGYGPLWRDATL
jgi:hypothetical protein